MNPYLALVISLLLLHYLLDLVVDLLNLRHASPTLPIEFKDHYDPARYQQSQEYLKVNIRFGMIKGSGVLVATLAFLLFGGFDWFDRLARSFGFEPIPTGLIYTGSLLLAIQILSLPFSVYRTFVIEQRFGFNKTTPKTFVQDLLKQTLLLAILGGILLSMVIWLFEAFTSSAWYLAWASVTGFGLVLSMLAPALLLPLFNRFTPLAPGDTRAQVEAYASQQGFKMRGIFTMDGSRRSSKSNAFFTGFGRFRRIVLFDTLLAKHSASEIVAILAHEMGHYRKRHILIHWVFSTATTGLMFYLLSLFINNRLLFDAFGIQQLSIYASLVLFGFLYGPISLVLNTILHALSRRHEYQADAYSANTTQHPEHLMAALFRLSADNLANLTPHPLEVFLNYSHPPILDRIRHLAGQHSAGKSG